MTPSTLKDNLGYASASLADALSYNCITAYFMFFVTTVAGIDPAMAGVITMVSAVWTALVNPLVGYCCDQIHTRFGRRRPVMLLFSFPLAISLILVFTNNAMTPGVKPFWYAFCLMLFWLSYTGFFVPYLALGAVYTKDYDKRTVLRLFASGANTAGALIGNALPSAVAFMTARGFTTDHAWTTASVVIGVICFLTIAGTVMASREKDPPCASSLSKVHFSFRELFLEYISVLRLPPVRYLIAASITSLIAFTMLLSDSVYFLTFNMGFSAALVTICLMIRPSSSLIGLYLVAKISFRTDKRVAYVVLVSAGILGMFVLRITGVHSFAGAVVYMLLMMLCSGIYWAVLPGMYYDVCDYDRWINGTERQGTISSFQGLVESLSGGIGTLILGFLLSRGGFDGSLAVQSQAAMDWIFHCATVVPALFLIISCIAIWKFPITRKMYDEMINAMK